MIELSNLGNFKYKVSYVIEGNIVSYIIYEEVVDTINIVDVYTIEEYRRKGYSKCLFNFLFKEYNKRFMLEVRTKNISAVGLYESLGFKTIYVRKKYYKDDDAFIMERSVM